MIMPDRNFSLNSSCSFPNLQMTAFLLSCLSQAVWQIYSCLQVIFRWPPDDLTLAKSLISSHLWISLSLVAWVVSGPTLEWSLMIEAPDPICILLHMRLRLHFCLVEYCVFLIQFLPSG